MRALGAALLGSLVIAAAASQGPLVVHSAGPFTATRLAQPPVIDGREWIATTVETVSEPGEVPVAAKMFSLAATDCGDHGGDFERCQLFLRRGRETPVRIDSGYTGWVFVTPDERYVVTEPLDVLDVRTWKQYLLSEALDIPNHTDVRAISRDGRRLLVAQTDCPMDCRGEQRYEHYEVRLP